MARLIIGSTFGIDDLNNLFDHNDYSGIGGQRYPRVSSNISANNHFRSRTFYKFDELREAASNPGGGVQVNSPFTTLPADLINMSIYVFDDTIHTSMTIEAVPDLGFTFSAWQGRETTGGARTFLSANNPATFSFSNIYQYNFIEADFN